MYKVSVELKDFSKRYLKNKLKFCYQVIWFSLASDTTIKILNVFLKKNKQSIRIGCFVVTFLILNAFKFLNKILSKIKKQNFF